MSDGIDKNLCGKVMKSIATADKKANYWRNGNIRLGPSTSAISPPTLIEIVICQKTRIILLSTLKEEMTYD
ncbi:hypothetical protein [Vibrio vulnificus]|uniref:hypothetical protein n=1 Tax=Vibrio vulnificus TaxID=672 RepID=UPI000933F638|nr:hypothetical protein [Vibrio vulnificus]EHT4939941.1 hypothetical protein [Vibrio vulnificus]MBF4452250.1 hypothetical protein [Vibrio vulnificus]MBF4498639.1 hypothetical protein [Vibrio vulnificus]MBL6180681.1 hypothetical protein [Vibrio vulnificus]POB04133.1 hypothetical protein CRN33_18800 [Vibrio vulnificus]